MSVAEERDVVGLLAGIQDALAKLVHCILENGYALAMIAGWYLNV